MNHKSLLTKFLAKRSPNVNFSEDWKYLFKFCDLFSDEKTKTQTNTYLQSHILCSKVSKHKIAMKKRNRIKKKKYQGKKERTENFSRK